MIQKSNYPVETVRASQKCNRGCLPSFGADRERERERGQKRRQGICNFIRARETNQRSTWVPPRTHVADKRYMNWRPRTCDVSTTCNFAQGPLHCLHGLPLFWYFTLKPLSNQTFSVRPILLHILLKWLSVTYTCLFLHWVEGHLIDSIPVLFDWSFLFSGWYVFHSCDVVNSREKKIEWATSRLTF